MPASKDHYSYVHKKQIEEAKKIERMKENMQKKIERMEENSRLGMFEESSGGHIKYKK